MTEEWKHISKHNLPLGYEISSEGNLRLNYGDRQEVIEPKLNNSGYLVMYIQGQILQIHRLVAEEFIPNPYAFKFVIHVDGDKQNNSVDNLRWASYRGGADALSASLRMGKLVRCITTGKIYSTLTSAQAHTGIPIPAIEEACKSGEICFGLQFEYVGEAAAQKCKKSDLICIPTALIIKCSKTMNSYKEFQKKYSRGLKKIEDLYEG